MDVVLPIILYIVGIAPFSKIIGIALGPMKLVEVYIVGLEPFKATVNCLQNRVARKSGGPYKLRKIGSASDLCAQNDLIAVLVPFEPTAYNFFGQ